MIQEALLYHVVTINLFLFLLATNLLIPWLFRRNEMREIKATRITFFLFSSLLSMVAFTGVILFMIAELSWNTRMSLMVVAFITLTGIEVARSMKLRRLWLRGESGVSLSWRYVLIEIVIIVAVIFFTIVDKKDAIPLP